MFFRFDLCQKLLDVVQVPPCLQPHLVRVGPIRSRRWGLADYLEPCTQRLVDDMAKRRPPTCGDRPRPLEHIAVYGECGSHACIIDIALVDVKASLLVSVGMATAQGGVTPSYSAGLEGHRDFCSGGQWHAIVCGGGRLWSPGNNERP